MGLLILHIRNLPCGFYEAFKVLEAFNPADVAVGWSEQSYIEWPRNVLRKFPVRGVPRIDLL
jgi:hypothetical protein